jgi:hypothetical protein
MCVVARAVRCGRDRSRSVSNQHPPVEERRLRRRPPCRDFGGDARSQELAGRIVQRSRQISALHCEQLADVAEFDRAEGWRGDGAVSMVAWVTGQCGVSTSTARQWVRSAANLEALPCLASGLASGELSLDLVEPLAEVATASTDAVLREASADWSVRQARQLAAWHRAQEQEAANPGRGGGSGGGDEDDVGGSEGDDMGSAGDVQAAREFDRRTLRFNDTRRSVWVAFTKDDYAAAKSALVGRVSADKRESERAGRGSVGSADPVESDPVRYVPYDQRLYDALMHLFRLGSEPASGRRRAVRPRVVVHAPLELLTGCSAVPGVAEIQGVGPVSAEVARRLACDANVVLSVDARDGSILDQGRARRDPTVAQRVEIARRDKGCRFPGCSFTEFTDIHHVLHWIRGGETNLDNLVTLCDRHHKAVHELGWVMKGDANSVMSFTSPHGRVGRSVPSPTWRRTLPSFGSPRSAPMRR